MLYEVILLDECNATVPVFIKPPGMLVPGGLQVFLFLNSFHREISEFPRPMDMKLLPHDQKYVEFCNPGPKMWGPPQKKSGGQKRAKQQKSKYYNFHLYPFVGFWLTFSLRLRLIIRFT